MGVGTRVAVSEQGGGSLSSRQPGYHWGHSTSALQWTQRARWGRGGLRRAPGGRRRRLCAPSRAQRLTLTSPSWLLAPERSCPDGRPECDHVPSRSGAGTDVARLLRRPRTWAPGEGGGKRSPARPPGVSHRPPFPAWPHWGQERSGRLRVVSGNNGEPVLCGWKMLPLQPAHPPVSPEPSPKVWARLPLGDLGGGHLRLQRPTLQDNSVARAGHGHGDRPGSDRPEAAERIHNL